MKARNHILAVKTTCMNSTQALDQRMMTQTAKQQVGEEQCLELHQVSIIHWRTCNIRQSSQSKLPPVCQVQMARIWEYWL